MAKYQDGMQSLREQKELDEGSFRDTPNKARALKDEDVNQFRDPSERKAVERDQDFLTPDKDEMEKN